MIRRILMAAAAGAVAAAVALPGPARAHAALALTVNDDGRGSISVDVVWADGHPVTETIAATLMATGPAQVGPEPLTRLRGSPTVVNRQPLPPGTWQVVVDVALPAIGRCAAPVTVTAAASAKPGTTRCAPPAEPVAAAPESRPAGWLPVAGIVAAVAVAVALVAGARRRRPSAAGRRH